MTTPDSVLKDDVAPLTDEQLELVFKSLELIGEPFVKTAVAHIRATLSERNAQIAVLVEALQTIEREVGEWECDGPDNTLGTIKTVFIEPTLANLPTSAKALLERVEKAERERDEAVAICDAELGAEADARDIARNWKARAEALVSALGNQLAKSCDETRFADHDAGCPRAIAAEARISELEKTQRTLRDELTQAGIALARGADATENVHRLASRELSDADARVYRALEALRTQEKSSQQSGEG